jgi:uncharacterized protein YjiK
MMRGAAALCFTIIAGLAACSKNAADSPDVAQREAEVKRRIAAAANGGSAEPVAKWLMPETLREISGIAFTTDGRILAHNDERSRVFVIDPMKGVITKQFSVGERGMTADFEAIAVSGQDFFLLTSNGDIYQFREGDDDGVVPFTKHVTGLGSQCEFEGLEVESRTRAFILACKNISKKSERNQLLLFRWLKQDGGAASVTRISVPLREAIGSNDWKQLSPSDIAIDPATGNYLLITGPERALIEVTPQGDVVQSMPLPGNHQQPEGVALTPDGLLIVADEAVERDADITIYSWRSISRRDEAAAGDTTAATDTTRADSTAAVTN